MQLTKAEIAETQIIVTTPEKWDVVTRKPTGEGELATVCAPPFAVVLWLISLQKVKLLIIDEVHLLNDERGAVIETIVARTIRQVESTQSMIRIVGLSATLPNYIDVADFLQYVNTILAFSCLDALISVSRQVGLFYFDSSFRPVPLETRFIGIKGKSGSPISRRNFDRVTYERVLELVREGHQVMVFVHARKETVKAALALKEAATQEGDIDIFSCADDPRFAFFRRDIGMSKNKEMKQLFDSGFGIHHAGMLRSDRNLMERLFEAKAIKVLCCTATLAWGVNLPAHAVIIKVRSGLETDIMLISTFREHNSMTQPRANLSTCPSWMYSRSLVALVVQEWRAVAWAIFVPLKTNLPIIWMLSLLRCVVSKPGKFLSHLRLQHPIESKYVPSLRQEYWIYHSFSQDLRMVYAML